MYPYNPINGLRVCDTQLNPHFYHKEGLARAEDKFHPSMPVVPKT